MTNLISQNYSGIIIDQNYSSTTAVTVPQTFTQTFNLPENFQRGSYIPSLTGFQIKIESTNSNNINANWIIFSNSNSRSGVVSKCALDANGVGWLDIKCDPLEISDTDLNKTFTLSIEFLSGSSVTKIYQSGSTLAHRVFASTQTKVRISYQIVTDQSLLTLTLITLQRNRKHQITGCQSQTRPNLA